MRQSYSIAPRRVAVILSGVALFLALISLIGEYLLVVVFAESESRALLLIDLFSVNIENSIPTWYSTMLLVAAALLLALIAHAKWSIKDRFRRHWAGLALIFLYLSIDEGAGIHEYMADFLFEALETTGYLFFAWQIAAVPLVILFGLVYVRFVFHLPPFTRYGFILAAIVYVGGALFIEGLSANHFYNQGGEIDFTYLAIATVEETCEMLGMALFIGVLLAYMRRSEAVFSLSASGEIIAADADTHTVPPDEESPESPPHHPDIMEQLYGRMTQSGVIPYVIVLLAGINLIFIQWVLVRELTTMLRGTELVILLVTISYFVGLSVGYRFSGRVKREWLPLLGGMVLLLHITLPVWFRLLVAGLDAIGAFAIAFIVLPLIVPFAVSAFYSIFLPLFADNGEGKLATLYGVEVLGAVIGVAALVLLMRLDTLILFVVYAAILLLILALLGLPRHWWMRFALLAVGWLWFFSPLTLWSNTLWYQQLQQLPSGSRTLLSAYSPYQKVDVLEDPAGNRYLFLDGLEHFGTPSGIWLNIIMGRVPALIMRPDNAIALGGGSMELEGMIAAYAGHVTTVEIDPLVVDAGRDLFTDYNDMDTLTNRSVIVGDARHFIANSDDSYNLIVSALPAALTMQAAALHSVSFIEDAHAHLTPDGVFVMNLTGMLTPQNTTPRRIIASLLTTFDEVMVVTSNTVGLSFAYASDDLPFTVDQVRTFVEANGEYDYAILETAAVRAIAGDAEPITLDSLGFVLQTSLDRILALVGG